MPAKGGGCRLSWPSMSDLADSVMRMRGALDVLLEAQSFALGHPEDAAARRRVGEAKDEYDHLAKFVVPGEFSKEPYLVREYTVLVRRAGGGGSEAHTVALRDEVTVWVGKSAKRKRVLGLLDSLGESEAAAALRRDKSTTGWRRTLKDLARAALQARRELPWEALGIHIRTLARFVDR